MPRRKNNGPLNKRIPSHAKTAHQNQTRKPSSDDILSDSNDYIKESTSKIKKLIENNDKLEIRPSDNYLHKKFKKIAEVTDYSSKEKDKLPTNVYVDRPHSPPSEVISSLLSRCDDKQVCDIPSSANPGRYICPYCQLACAKPSVLQKHIRAHTNERPYPCSPCGFAFKTKSNLYKHRRSQAHRVKTGDGSGEDMSEESISPTPDKILNHSPNAYYPISSKPCQNEDYSENNFSKIYKPKFHKLYIDENFENTKLQENNEKRKNLPPSPEFLDQHISKIISDNQAIVETMEPQWSKKFLQRQNSRDKSPSFEEDYLKKVKELYRSPTLEDEYAKKVKELYRSPTLEEDYLKKVKELYRSPTVEEDEHRKMKELYKREMKPYPKAVNYLFENSHINTYHQPLNLTKKEEPKSGGSVIKELLIKARELGQYTPETMAEILNNLESQNKNESLNCEVCHVSCSSVDSWKVHKMYYCKDGYTSPKRIDVPISDTEPPPLQSPGPLLGNTPLVEKEPPLKKRRIQSTTIPPDPNQLYSRRLSTSSLPGTRTRSPITTLKSLEELSKYPMKPNTINMFGGEVKILDCGETKTMRIEANAKSPIDLNNKEETSKFYVTIAKTGLHSGGGTLVQMTSSPASTTSSFQMSNILGYPDRNKLLMPLAPNISTPNLSVPGVPTPNKMFPQTGVATIVHGGKHIPYVPGIPGPQNVFPLEKQEEKKSKSTVSSLLTVRKNSSVSKKNVPNEIPKIEIKKLENPPKIDESTEKPVLKIFKSGSGQKFLRPTSLPLKGGSFVPKRLYQGITPTVLSLVSPETPRPKKSYGQLYLNGHAYTYLGLKCSTKSYYCTISRPQPMYVILGAQHNKLSMYSNWKVYSEAEPNPFGLSPAKMMAFYDTRQRSSHYTIADSKQRATAASGSNTTLTHSSYWFNRIVFKSAKNDGRSDSSDSDKNSPNDSLPKRVKIFAGGYESNEEYTYVRGRGRGRYVCEECGIRCKKPSMLRKHIRTHTDVRPYICKQCSFSFKTKGNLTKHMKSKAHYKKCVELNVNPIPTTVEAENIIEELLLKQQALQQDGEDSDDEDEDEDSEDDDTTNEETEFLEREAACSLLSLSETPKMNQFTSIYISAGLIPKTANFDHPSTYPYRYSKQINCEEEEEEENKDEDSKESDFPMDLSQKDRRESNPVPAYLLASISNENLQPDRFVNELPDSRMLQAYLTAKALQDVQVKQHQNRIEREKFENMMQTLEIENRDDEDDDDDLLPDKLKCEVETDSDSCGSTRNQEMPVLTPERPDNVRVTLETSTGKKIFVTLPPEMERSGTPPSSFFSKTGDSKLKAEFFPPSNGPSSSYVSVTEDGRSICVICNKIFTKPSQLRLHVNIHYFERPFRCEACAVSFRTKGHLQKHERSVSHHNKVSMNTTFGTATTTNPRPFKCDDCKIAFRIHGHLAKHLRSKMHIMKLECIGKLPFGTYAEMERSGMNLNEIDTTDCENSLESLQALALRLHEKDPTKLSQWERNPPHQSESEASNDKHIPTEPEESSSDSYQSDNYDKPESNESMDNFTSYYMLLNKNKPKNVDVSKLAATVSRQENDRVVNLKDILAKVNENNKNKVQINCSNDTVRSCSLCCEKFESLSNLQIHMFAEHNKDMIVDQRTTERYESRNYLKIENQIKTRDENHSSS